MHSRLRQRFPTFRFRIIAVRARNSGILSISLSGVNSGKLFARRLRSSVLQNSDSFTIRSLGSLPAHLPRKLVLNYVARHRSPTSTLIVRRHRGSGALTALPRNTIVNASSLHHLTRLHRRCPRLTFGSVHNGLGAHLHGLSSNRCSNVVLTTTKLRHVRVSSHVRRLLPTSVSLRTINRNTLNVRYHANSSRVLDLLDILSRTPAATHYLTRHTFLHRLRNNYRIPVNIGALLSNSALALAKLITDLSNRRLVGGAIRNSATRTRTLKARLTRRLHDRNTRTVLSRVGTLGHT